MFPIMAGNSASTGYNLTRSLRFRASASAYLNRTMTTPTNNLKWTLSAWVKRGSVLTTENQIMNAGTAGSDDQFVFTTSSQLGFYVANGAAYYLITNAVYRDPAAWYHIVFVYDSANATAANRLLMYVNGTQVTSFATALYPTQNYASQINSAVLNRIGLRSNSASPFDGYLTEVNFIDGQALTPSSFGSTNALTGVWQPARYAGTYGTNGFYLPFTDNSALTTSSNVGLGKDFSGNGNYWTTNNISITAGVTYDSMTDVPTLTDASTANFPTISAVNYNSTYLTLSNGNLRQTYAGVSAAAASQATMAIPPTGKFYWEVYLTTIGTNSTTIRAGICRTTDAISGNTIDNSATAYSVISNGNKRNNASDTTYGASFSNSQTLQVLYDATNGAIYFGQNNSFANGSGSFNQAWATASAAFTSLSGEFIPFFITYGGSDISVNFGQRPFSYTPPTGYVALNTFNLPTSTIVKGNTVMDATLYTGTGASLSVTNAASFKPDLVWVKGRSGATDHAWYDSVRGVQKQLESNTTTAETTEATGLTAFGSAGFTVGALAQMNTSAATYVGWQWQAGQGTTSSNTNGTITSTVSVNASAGFSVVTFTGTGANGTVGHGLGVAPSMYIVKSRSAVGDWWVYHTSLGAGKAIFLSLTDAAATGAGYWNNTAPTSSVFTVGVAGGLNATGVTQLAYCWTPIAGYSAFGSYTGNGSADGPFVYTGFRPKWIMVKRTDSANNWGIRDSVRNGYNQNTPVLFADLANAEYNIAGFFEFDLVSNGFKVRNIGTGANTSGGTYIYMAFAETPFKNSLGR